MKTRWASVRVEGKGWQLDCVVKLGLPPSIIACGDSSRWHSAHRCPPRLTHACPPRLPGLPPMPQEPIGAVPGIDELGFLPGWGNTVGRVRESFQMLLDILQVGDWGPCVLSFRGAETWGYRQRAVCVLSLRGR